MIEDDERTRPRLICHMAASLDGRILPDRWTPQGVHRPKVYEELHGELGGGSWLVGRVTGAEFSKQDRYPDASSETFSREAWIPERSDAYAVVLDTEGKIAWGRSKIDAEPIVVVLTEQVSDAHLAGLRQDQVGYVFAGSTEIDLALALHILATELGIERLMLEGGGAINGAFLRAGLIDEISLIVEPAIDGREGAPCVFDGNENVGAADLSALDLIEHRPLGGSAIWLHYYVTKVER